LAYFYFKVMTTLNMAPVTRALACDSPPKGGATYLIAGKKIAGIFPAILQNF